MAKKDPEKRILTLPNALSVARIVLVAVFARLYLTAETGSERCIAAGVMAASMITDALDGIIARRFNLITTVGKVLDPVADKLTQAVILVCAALRLNVRTPLFVFLGIFAVKEAFMLVMGVYTLKKGKMLNGALIAGKVCTTVLFIGMALFVLFPDMRGGFVWAISAVCSAAMLVSLGFYISTYRGRNHGVDVVDVKK